MNLERWPRYDTGDGSEPIVAVKWKNSKSDADSPCLAVIWRSSRLTLLHNVTDDSNFNNATQLIDKYNGDIQLLEG